MGREKEQERLKSDYSESGWRTVSVPLNEPMIRLLSEHLRDVRELFDLSPEFREIAWLIDENRTKIEKALKEPPDIEKQKSGKVNLNRVYF